MSQDLRESPATRGGVSCFELAAWASELGLVAGVTARGADFGLASPEPTAAVLGRWRGFRAALRPHFHAVAVAHQCHATALTVHQLATAGWNVLDDQDGHLTHEPGLLLTVTVADCVPVYLAAGAWLGLVHAGWRGTAGGIAEQAVGHLAALSGCQPGDITIHCGVSICESCYEVDSEVYQAVTGEAARGKKHLDLRQALARRLDRAGVRRVTISPWCTAHDTAEFYSHRRSRGADGRMVAYLGRPSP